MCWLSCYVSTLWHAVLHVQGYDSWLFTVLLTVLQVSIAYMHLLGAEKPWETMLLGCLWLAAKLEECRRGVPTASKAGALVGVDKCVMGGVELYLMQLVNWAPLAGWKDRPLQSEDDSWY